MSKETKYRTFTIADMAFDLRVSSRTIRRMIRKKSFAPCYKVEGQVRCDYEDFYNWKDNQKEKFRRDYTR